MPGGRNGRATGNAYYAERGKAAQWGCGAEGGLRGAGSV